MVQFEGWLSCLLTSVIVLSWTSQRRNCGAFIWTGRSALATASRDATISMHRPCDTSSGTCAFVEIHRNPLRFQYRLHATEMPCWPGCDLTGKFLEDAPNKEWAELAKTHLSEVAATGTPQVTRHFDRLFDGLVWNVEALVLPLWPDGRTIDMLISAVVRQKRDRWGVGQNPHSRDSPVSSRHPYSGRSQTEAAHSSITRTISDISQSLRVTPAAIAGRDLQRLMDAHEIVVHEVDRHHVRVVFGLF